MNDIAIVGMGIYGTLLSKYAAEAGLKVVAFDKHIVPHSHGSTHGDSRLFRYATIEGDALAPIALLSARLWHEMNDTAATQFLSLCGTVIASEPGAENNVDHGVSGIVGRAYAMARKYGISHETLTGREIMLRFPNLPLGKRDHVYYEPVAFAIQPERALNKGLTDARAGGCEVHSNT